MATRDGSSLIDYIDHMAVVVQRCFRRWLSHRVLIRLRASQLPQIGTIIDPTKLEGFDYIRVEYVEDPRSNRSGPAPLKVRIERQAVYDDVHLAGIRAARELDLRICEGCYSFERTKACAGCGLARYCSKRCQEEAWPAHKRRCKISDRHCERRRQRAQQQQQQPATTTGPSPNRGNFEEMAQINRLREIEDFETRMTINFPRTDVDGTIRPPISNAEFTAEAALEEAYKEDMPHREGNWDSSA